MYVCVCVQVSLVLFFRTEAVMSAACHGINIHCCISQLDFKNRNSFSLRWLDFCQGGSRAVKPVSCDAFPVFDLLTSVHIRVLQGASLTA